MLSNELHGLSGEFRRRFDASHGVSGIFRFQMSLRGLHRLSGGVKIDSEHYLVMVKLYFSGSSKSLRSQ